MCEMVDFDPVAEILYLSCVILLFEFAGYALNLIFLSVQIQVVLCTIFLIYKLICKFYLFIDIFNPEISTVYLSVIR
jgi:hypothetical protein